MATQQKVKVSAKAVENAENVWQSFIALSKVSIYATCAILLILWVAFIVF